MRRSAWLLLLVMLIPAHSFAETQPLAWGSHRTLAERLSDAAVWTNISLDTVHSWRSEDRSGAFRCQALRMGVNVGATLAAKYAVHRVRPDGSNDHSFFSGHTANAMVASGWRLQVGIPIAVGAGYFRMAANKHFATDVAVGAAVGLLSRRVCR